MKQIRLIALAVSCLLAAGCATQTQKTPGDPFERVNRVTHGFNEVVLDVTRPIARGYRKIAPQFVETGVSNFMDNLSYPTVFVNDFLQGKVSLGFRDTGRFLINTTLGLAGFFDPASAMGLEENDEDFGQTLGKWGVGPGPYLVLPLLGPSTVRDGFGRIVDQGTDPLTYIERDRIRYTIAGVGFLDTRTRLLDAEAALEGAFDKYALMRSAYLQQREYLIHDGNVPEESLDEDWLEEAEKEAGLEEE